MSSFTLVALKDLVQTNLNISIIQNVALRIVLLRIQMSVNLRCNENQREKQRVST